MANDLPKFAEQLIEYRWRHFPSPAQATILQQRSPAARRQNGDPEGMFANWIKKDLQNSMNEAAGRPVA
jgi:hypothetical protein